MQDAVQKSEQMHNTAKKALYKTGKFAGRFLFKLIRPYIPILILVAVLIVLLFSATSIIYAQLTTEQSDIKADDGELVAQYIKEEVTKVNARNQYDAYGRDVVLELTEGQVWALLVFRNSAGTGEVSETEIQNITQELKPNFTYQTFERIVERLDVVIDPETEEPVLNNDGTQKKEWVVISRNRESLLSSADTIMGQYTYTYKETIETNNDTRITYMRPFETKLTGEPYERLRTYLEQNFNLHDDDIAVAVQAVLEASIGFETQEDRMAWLIGGGSTWSMSYVGIPADIIPAIQEAAQMYNIPEWLISAVIRIESNFNPLACNPSSSAYGLMQIMPFHIEGGLFERLGFSRTVDRDNPRAQVIAGTYLLRRHIGNIAVDWFSEIWKQQTLKGIANYGGYPNNKLQEAEAKYVSKVWATADMYKTSGINTGMIWPLPGHIQISSYFGTRADPITGEKAFHSGVDIPVPVGTPVLSATSGRVVFAGSSGGYGNMVVIESGRYNILYAHNSTFLVHEGQEVRAGHPIAKSGNTGRSTGPHLHFSVSIGHYKNGGFIDPLSQITPH
jgi:hypothetical protein